MGRLSDYINGVIDIKNEETREKAQWEFYLHKVFDKTFPEYLKEVEKPATIEVADMKEVETTVKNSMDILKNFNLE